MSGLFKFVACDASVLGSILSLFLGRPFLGPICVDSATSSLAFAELEVGIRLKSKALNAIKVLNEKLDSYQPTSDFIKDMVLLEHVNDMCVKAIDKYLTYLNNDVKPLFKDDVYLKQSTLLLYSEKDKTMNDISIKVKKHILDAKFKLNNKSSYLVWVLFAIIIIMMAFSFFY